MWACGSLESIENLGNGLKYREIYNILKKKMSEINMREIIASKGYYMKISMKYSSLNRGDVKQSIIIVSTLSNNS
jgi:hypothetical protein